MPAAPAQEALIRRAYAAFNARDADAVLAEMQPDVHWPNGWEGGTVQGRDAVRDYWTRQWAEINPVVTPLSTVELPDGRVQVTVHQRVLDGQGAVLFDGALTHTYTFQDGLIQRMEIGA